MNEFNKIVNNDRAILKSFSGASSKEMVRYVLHTLQDNNFDTAVIHVGINNLAHNSSKNSQEQQTRTTN